MEYNFQSIKCIECNNYWSNEDCDSKCSLCFIEWCIKNNVEIPIKFKNVKGELTSTEISRIFEVILDGRTKAGKYWVMKKLNALKSDKTSLFSTLNDDILQQIYQNLSMVYDRNIRVTDKEIKYLSKFLENKDNTSVDFLNILKELEIISVVVLLKDGEICYATTRIIIVRIFTAKQVALLLRSRKLTYNDNDNKDKSIWQHILCCLVGDFWNLTVPEHGIGECYYKREAPKFISFDRDDSMEIFTHNRSNLLDKIQKRTRLSLSQIKFSEQHISKGLEVEAVNMGTYEMISSFIIDPYIISSSIVL